MTSSTQERPLALRYARALYDLSSAHGEEDGIANELAQFATFLDEVSEFQRLCCSPIISAEARVEAVSALSKHCNASPLMTDFLLVLAKNDRLSLLKSIGELFTELSRKARGEVEAIITTARPLGAKDKKRVSDALKSAYQQSVVTSMRVDTRLIGGIKIKIGSQELDASVQGKLAQAAARLYESIQHA
jgi:F-type H+-transporting ATPase subunit delta